MDSNRGLTPRFEELGPFKMAGSSEFYTDATMSGIHAQWQRFVPHLGKVPGQVGRVTYGLIVPKPEAQGWEYACAVEVTDFSRLPVDFKSFSLEKTKYAVFTHEGYLSTLRDTLGYIWEKWLPQSQLKITRGPRVEKYSETFRPDAPGGIEIWIPLAAN